MFTYNVTITVTDCCTLILLLKLFHFLLHQVGCWTLTFIDLWLTIYFLSLIVNKVVILCGELRERSSHSYLSFCLADMMKLKKIINCYKLSLLYCHGVGECRISDGNF